MIVFDLDDTLYLERQFVISGFQAVEDHLKTKGKPPHPYATRFLDVLDRDGSGRVFNKVLDALHVEADIGELVRIYQHHEPRLSPLAGMRDLVLSCHEPGVITDGPEEIQRRKLRALGLLEHFRVVVCTSNLAPNQAAWKPSVQPYQHIEATCNQRGVDCTYIGDNPRKDFIGAVQQGWRPVRLRMDGQLHAALPTPDGVKEVTSVHALTQWIQP